MKNFGRSVLANFWSSPQRKEIEKRIKNNEFLTNFGQDFMKKHSDFSTDDCLKKFKTNFMTNSKKNTNKKIWLFLHLGLTILLETFGKFCKISFGLENTFEEFTDKILQQSLKELFGKFQKKI